MTTTLNQIKAELMGKEIKLLDLDNYMQEHLDTTTSVFGFERQYWGCFTWGTGENEAGYGEGINVDFDVLNPDETDDLKIIVKVKEVSEY
jgi:hypothetical protein